MFKERANNFWYLLPVLVVFSWPSIASAHEAYVLTAAQWQSGLHADWFNVFSPLWQLNRLLPFLLVKVSLGALIAVSLYWGTTTAGQWLDRHLLSWNALVKLALRLTLAAVLLIGAQSGHIFGPELALNTLPLANVLPYMLYGLSFLLILGWMTELASLLCLIIFGLTIWTYGFYSFNYLFYFSSALALLLFGAGAYSLDHEAIERPDQINFEALIIRLGFGLSILFSVISIKVLHPAISLSVINQFQLSGDPSLLLALVTLVELVLALCLTLGFQTRFFALLIIAYSLISILVLSELVWPHLLLFAMAIFLLANNGGQFSLDNYLAGHLRQPKDKR